MSSKEMRRLMETVENPEKANLNEGLVDLVFDLGLAAYIIPAFIKMFQAYCAEKKGQHARTEELMEDLSHHFMIPVDIAIKLFQAIEKRVMDRMDQHDGHFFERHQIGARHTDDHHREFLGKLATTHTGKAVAASEEGRRKGKQGIRNQGPIPDKERKTRHGDKARHHEKVAAAADALKGKD